MRDRAGSAIGLCLIGRDLSEIKELIKKLTEAKEGLEAEVYDRTLALLAVLDRRRAPSLQIAPRPSESRGS